MILGIKNSILQYILLGIGAYLLIITLVILEILHPLCLIVLSLPLLVKNIKEIRTAKIDKPKNIKDMDGKSAQLVIVFSLLLIISNFVAGFIVGS